MISAVPSVSSVHVELDGRLPSTAGRTDETTKVGSYSLEEKKLEFPNQVVHDPDTWTAPHLLHLKSEYDVLVNKYGYIMEEMLTLQGLCVKSGVTSTRRFSSSYVTVSTCPI
jgi:hypothetical protein